MENKKNKGKIPLVVYFIFFFGMLIVLNMFRTSYNVKEITYSEFKDMIDAKQIEKITIGNDTIDIVPNSDSEYSNKKLYTIPVNDEKLVEQLRESGIKFSAKDDSMDYIYDILITWILPLGMIFLFYKFIFSKAMGKVGGSIGGMVKSKAKVYIENEISVTFKDVAGQEEAKESLEEVIGYLNNPSKYTEIGAKLPKGALLVGPPGTGKTLLAKAVAGEAKVPFFSLAGSSFVEMYAGVGASRVRELFKEAEEKAPCIIFIDEIDAIGKSRDSQLHSNDEREQTLNQLLSEMDGFDSNNGIVILAATNRPEILDKALLRPGRFDRRVIVDRPDFKGREAILKVHAKDVNLDPEVDLTEVAKGTPGAVGADLANIVNEAA